MFATNDMHHMSDYRTVNTENKMLLRCDEAGRDLGEQVEHATTK
jgi:hypothetical protein